MSGIKSLADELRDSMRKGKPPQAKEITPAEQTKDTPKKKTETLERLFENILNHGLTGRDKLLIRVGVKPRFLLEQLTATKGIDMNKIISYSLHHFPKAHPALTRYIKEHI